MENNGSPAPIFETDDQIYILVTLPAHDLFQTGVQESNQVGVIGNFHSISSLENLFAIIGQAGVELSDQVSVEVSDQVAAIVSNEIGPYSIDVLNDIRINPKPRRILLKILV